MKLHEKLDCFGLMGFAIGYEWGKANIAPTESLDWKDGYCATKCPQAALCLTATRWRAQIMFPKATKAFDELMKKTSQVAATFIWRKKHPDVPTEPYALLFYMLCEDGLSYAQTGKPKDRGTLTLNYPGDRNVARKQEEKKNVAERRA